MIITLHYLALSFLCYLLGRIIGHEELEEAIKRKEQATLLLNKTKEKV